eukprot:403953_1
MTIIRTKMMLTAVIMMYLIQCTLSDYVKGDILKVVGLTSNSSTAKLLNNQFVEITKNKSAGRYPVRLLSDHSVEAKVREENLITTITIQGESHRVASDPLLIMVAADPLLITLTHKVATERAKDFIGIEFPSGVVDVNRRRAGLPDNVFGFENKQAWSFFALTLEKNVSNYQIVAHIMMTNPHLLRATLQKLFPEQSNVTDFLMFCWTSFRDHASKNFAAAYQKADRESNDAGFKYEDMGNVCYSIWVRMEEDFVWKLQEWKHLLNEINKELMNFLKMEYFDYGMIKEAGQGLEEIYKIETLTQFINTDLERIDFIDCDNRDKIPVLVVLRDLLSAKNIVVKHRTDVSKNMYIRVTAAHVKTLAFFVKQRLTDLGYEHVDQMVHIADAIMGDTNCEVFSSLRQRIDHVFSC